MGAKLMPLVCRLSGGADGRLQRPCNAGTAAGHRPAGCTSLLISLREVNLDSGYLMTVGKGNKERLVPSVSRPACGQLSILTRFEIRLIRCGRIRTFFFPVLGEQ